MGVGGGVVGACESEEMRMPHLGGGVRVRALQAAARVAQLRLQAGHHGHHRDKHLAVPLKYLRCGEQGCGCGRVWKSV